MSSSKPASFNLRVFAEDGRSGNLATVSLLDGAPRASPSFLPDASTTHCFAWRENDAVATLCQQAGQTIRFCGHGLLAIVWSWHQRHGEMPLLLAAGERMQGRTDSTRGWLSRSRIPTQTVDPAAATVGIAHDQVIAAALAGGNEGYRLLEIGADVALAALAFDYPAITRRDRRALIVTQRSSDPRYDYLIRYSAPQYGSPEDRATGSANAVAADYWARKLDKSRLVGLQTPALADPDSGGVIHCELDHDRITLGGELRLCTGL